MSAYDGLPNASLAAGPLLSGRVEQILPFVPPFNEEAFLLRGAWTDVAADYLGSSELDLDAVTAVLAPQGSAPQPLHRDVQAGPAAVLTIHIPLVDVPSGGGALLL